MFAGSIMLFCLRPPPVVGVP